MRRLAVVLAVAGIALPSALPAQEPLPRWLFGFESRVSQAEPHFSRDYALGFIPTVSYYLSPRFRIDGFLGIAYANSDDYSLYLMPGARYYHRPGPGKLRLNSGLSVGFQLHEEPGDREYERRLREQFPEAFIDVRDEVLFLRLVPVEVEYWLGRRGAVTVGLDYQMRLLDGATVDDEGAGVTAGFRLRLK